MADPLSIAASVLAVVTAAIQSTKSLRETVQRFKDRDKTLRRLQDELEDLTNILNSLNEAVNVETSMLMLLQGPVLRCSQVCREFEISMEEFSGKSKTGFRDWAKMEFRRGSINEFIDTLTGYKSTISVGLGTITMHTSRLSHQVIEEYTEMIKDTTYNLKIHMQRIDEKMATFQRESLDNSAIDLEDEKAVTDQCLRICENARSYIESLTTQEPSLQYSTPPKSSGSEISSMFAAQLLTRQALDHNRDRFVEIISTLRARLEELTLNGASASDREKLQEDINVSKQCLEVCKLASTEVDHQKIHCIGEVIADGDSDQIVVTTLADLFDVKKAMSKGRSAQLVGSMRDETLRQVSENRYNSRFGAVTVPLTSTPGIERSNNRSSQQIPKEEQPSETDSKRSRPSPNEMRKRRPEGDN